MRVSDGALLVHYVVVLTPLLSQVFFFFVLFFSLEEDECCPRRLLVAFCAHGATLSAFLFFVSFPPSLPLQLREILKHEEEKVWH